MNTGKAYAEMMQEKRKTSFLKPLLGAWEFLPKPFQSFTDWEKDVAQLQQMAAWHRWVSVPDFEKEIRLGKRTIVVTSPEQQIEYVSTHFLGMTGYSSREALGRKPNFLQGKDTDPLAVQAVREAVKARQPVESTILNYKKEGVPYLCEVNILPLYNEEGVFSHFMALEQEV